MFWFKAFIANVCFTSPLVGILQLQVAMVNVYMFWEIPSQLTQSPIPSNSIQKHSEILKYNFPIWISLNYENIIISTQSVPNLEIMLAITPNK